MTNEEHRASAERLMALAYLPKITAQDVIKEGFPAQINTRQLVIELAIGHALMGMYPSEKTAPKVRTGIRKMSGQRHVEPKSSGS